MRLYESSVVHVELLDRVSACSRQNLGSDYVLPVEVVLAQLHSGVHHAAKAAQSWNQLENYQLSLQHREFDVELSSLGNLHDKVRDLDVYINLEYYVHRLVIIHIIIALRELGQMLPVPG